MGRRGGVLTFITSRQQGICHERKRLCAKIFGRWRQFPGSQCLQEHVHWRESDSDSESDSGIPEEAVGIGVSRLCSSLVQLIPVPHSLLPHLGEWAGCQVSVCRLGSLSLPPPLQSLIGKKGNERILFVSLIPLWGKIPPTHSSELTGHQGLIHQP